MLAVSMPQVVMGLCCLIPSKRSLLQVLHVELIFWTRWVHLINRNVFHTILRTI
jgi:hypothetical protein